MATRRKSAVLSKRLIAHWTNPEYATFVGQCAALVNTLAKEVEDELRRRKPQLFDDAEKVTLTTCEDAFSAVLMLMKRLWPDVARVHRPIPARRYGHAEHYGA